MYLPVEVRIEFMLFSGPRSIQPEQSCRLMHLMESTSRLEAGCKFATQAHHLWVENSDCSFVLCEWWQRLVLASGSYIKTCPVVFILTRTLLHQYLWCLLTTLQGFIALPEYEMEMSCRPAVMCPLPSVFVVLLHQRWGQNTCLTGVLVK